MKKLFTDNKVIGNEAVSPVVGVMLMLVVTIIIAAVVSAFAGGLTESTSKAPQVILKGTYSQSEGLTLSHQGGDAIATSDTIVIVRLGDTFGSAEHMAWRQNATNIVDTRGKEPGSANAWLRSAGHSGVKSFAPGDNAFIEYPYSNFTMMQPGLTLTSSGGLPTNGLINPANIGKTFWVELTDKEGKIFGKTEVTIAP